MLVRRITHSVNHEHPSSGLDFYEILGQVPRGAKHLLLDELRYLLLQSISLLQAVLVRSLTDLVSVRNFIDSQVT